jgi:transposase
MKSLPAKIDDREDKLIEYLVEGHDIRKAGKLAGYNRSYYKTDITRKWQSDSFITKLLKRHRAEALALLPKSHLTDKTKLNTAQDAINTLQEAINKTKDPTERLDLYRKGMGILSKLDATQERIAKNSGLLKEQHHNTQVIVPIKDMQVILNQTIQSGSQPEAIDVTPQEDSSHG